MPANPFGVSALGGQFEADDAPEGCPDGVFVDDFNNFFEGLEMLCMVLISYSSRETLALSAASSTTSRRQSKSLGLMVAEMVRPETLMLPI